MQTDHLLRETVVMTWAKSMGQTASWNAFYGSEKVQSEFANKWRSE